MTTIPRLHRRQNGKYHCRVSVPEDLRSLTGKRELHISLQTSDPTLAKQRLLLESIKIDQRFAALRGLPVPEFNLDSDTRHGAIMLSSKKSIALSVLIDRYFAASEQSHLSVKTKLEYGIRFKVVKELLGADRLRLHGFGLR